MLAKLAWRNVRRSVRDYAIYFVTLVFGVAVFYAFNSIESQQILFDIQTEAQSNVFATTSTIMSMFSVVIACVLGFLIVYANRFLVRRRKHEFGTYLVLGMRPGQVSLIVLMETLLVGVVSFAVGLALGVALSQGLSFFTAALFNISMQRYIFIFSTHAFTLTITCFVVIYGIVALFNTLTVSRCKLINLLSARSREERGRVRNPWISFAGFVVAVGLIAAAYITLIDNGMVMLDEQFGLATGLMLVGTLLLFWSLAGFVIAVIQRTRGVYFKGLAMFTVRQISSKVNSAFMSLWAVCILLFFSITVFSVGMGLVNVFTGNVEEVTVYDASLTARVFQNTSNVEYYDTGEYADETGSQPNADEKQVLDETMQKNLDLDAEARSYSYDIAARLEATNPNWDAMVAQQVQVNVFRPNENTTTYGELMKRFNAYTGNAEIDAQMAEQSLDIVSVSQFNAARELSGREIVEVGEYGYAVNNCLDSTQALAQAMAQEGMTLQIAGHELSATGSVVKQSLVVTDIAADGAEVIVPDWVVEELLAAGEAPYVSYLNMNYNVERTEGDRLLGDAIALALPPQQDNLDYGWNYDTEAWPVTYVYTADQVIAQAGGMRMMITYLALYIGFIFLITTAAVLAIQQLSETSDSLERYRMLAELGCDRSMVFRSLRKQILVYFLAPLVVAVCHSVCAVSVVSDTLLSGLGVSVAEPALMAAVLVAIVYGGYLLVTYYASRSLVRASLGKKLIG